MKTLYFEATKWGHINWHTFLCGKLIQKVYFHVFLNYLLCFIIYFYSIKRKWKCWHPRRRLVVFRGWFGAMHTFRLNVIFQGNNLVTARWTSICDWHKNFKERAQLRSMYIRVSLVTSPRKYVCKCSHELHIARLQGATHTLVIARMQYSNCAGSQTWLCLTSCIRNRHFGKTGRR